MFMFFMWIMVCVAGSVVAGQVAFVRTVLTADITETSSVILVRSTSGYPSAGIIVIGDEHIAYSRRGTTSFYGVAGVSPLVRGAEGTAAAAHAAGSHVTSVPGSMLNNSVSYNIAVLSDASGLMAFITVPFALVRLLGSFFTLPLSFLGTNLQIISILWVVIAAGMLVAVAVQLSGARRV